jgi:hypothetical protein
MSSLRTPKPPTVKANGLQLRMRRQPTCSFSLSFPTPSSDIGGQLDLALLAHHPARFARSGVGSLLGRLELGHHLGHRASRDLAVELLHLAVDHLDARLLDSSSRI